MENIYKYLILIDYVYIYTHTNTNLLATKKVGAVAKHFWARNGPPSSFRGWLIMIILIMNEGSASGIEALPNRPPPPHQKPKT